MKLLIDLGNSRCKYAILRQGKNLEYGIKEYAPFGKLYCVKSLCDQFGDLEKVIISSVLSEKMNADMKSTLVEKDNREVYFLQPVENSFTITLAYPDPSTIGSDRVAAMLAVHEKYSGNYCVIDCGTATTIDVLNEKGMHQGGVILPGYTTMQKALSTHTNIDTKQTSQQFELLANTTEIAVHTGCLSATVGGIEYVVNKMSSDYDVFDKVIMTGGNARNLQACFSKNFQNIPIMFDDNLVLDGLKIVAEHY